MDRKMCGHARAAVVWLSTALGGAAVGCGPEQVAFDVEQDEDGRPTLAPLEDNTAQWPAEADGESHPEVLEVATPAGAPAPGWAHARGYLHAGIAEVWEAMRDPDVVVNKENAVSYRLKGECDLQGLAYCFEYESTVDIPVAPVDLESVTMWRHFLKEGEMEAPEEVVVVYKSTENPPGIELATGSLELIKIDEETTGVAFIGWLDTWGSDAGNTDAMVDYAHR